MLTIKKHTSLHTRFPESVAATNLDVKYVSAVVYSQALTPERIDRIEHHCGETFSVIAAWKVGQYDVLLLRNPLTAPLIEALEAHRVDYAPFRDLPDLSQPGLAVFDMDSTAIQIECIDEIAKLAGVGEQVAKVTERAMQGELDFEQSLRERVATLAGASDDILEQVRQQLPLMPEIRELIAALHQYGWKTAIASGGFTYFSDYLKEELQLAHAQSNQLEIVDGKLTGQVLGNIVDAQAKADILLELAEAYDIAPHNTLAVGDGANDLVMMSAAGLGLAYHAKPKVVATAPAAVRFADLGGVLCLLSASLWPQKIGW
ncbi:phosphoserine phosphatase [Photobacterium sp. 1_MG-2023]|uniref:phosphoserine phosphatase n=1 Tax=Photobacterium sp. 1_MG-2023 TaxID=3062646 RepID=UPI0026E374F4|nr:phosphoserine phosphatase [Photobacterium sp. 1_MG-2023]MDO6704715.1 phosphoserine phosphatase [Photobacterium sp. 1_MG-2023]